MADYRNMSGIVSDFNQGRRKARTKTGRDAQAKTGQTYLKAPMESRRYTSSGAPTSSVATSSSRTPAIIPGTSGGGTGGQATGASSPTYSAAGVPADIVASRSGVQAADNSNVMDQNFTGWAEGVKPDAIPMLFQEPQALLRQVMASMGMSANTNPGMYNMALPNADLANALAMIQLGASPDFSQGNTNAVLNQMGDFFQQGLTRGGQGVDFRSGMGNLMGAGIGTPLGDFLNLDDPRGQVQAMSSLMMPLAEAGLHPLFAQSLQSEINRLADEYYSRSAFGTPNEGGFQGMLNKRLGGSF